MKVGSRRTESIEQSPNLLLRKQRAPLHPAGYFSLKGDGVVLIVDVHDSGSSTVLG